MKTKFICSVSFLTAICSSLAYADSKSLTLVMTNDLQKNMIQVYDSSSHALLQTLPTGGKGGVSGNARGVRQFGNKLFAAVNNGSKSVSIFERQGNTLSFVKTIPTSSAPVSIDFRNNHMYVAGATTADSFVMIGDQVYWQDGSVDLLLAEGGTPPVGSTAQVGALAHQLLVTLKSDPTPGTVDVIPLERGGAIAGALAAVAGPEGSLTPFGFSALTDDSALITLAHSGQVGLFRDGAFKSVIVSGGQAGPCWSTQVGKYVLIVNAGSQTLSREIASGSNIFIDAAIAANITTGGAPTDMDINYGLGAVLDHNATTSHLSFFQSDLFAELTAEGAPIDLGVPNANGVAIMAPQ
jgi:DNA-binding beta-propeller fold protein YncE